MDRDTCQCLRNDTFFKDCSLLFLKSQNLLLTFIQSSQTTNTAPSPIDLQLDFQQKEDFLKFYNGKDLNLVLELELNGQAIALKNQSIHLVNNTVTTLSFILPTISQPGNVSALLEIWDVRTSMKISKLNQ